MTHRYTIAEIDFMLDFCKSHSYKDTQKAFNEKYNTNLTVDAIKYMCNTRGIYAFNKKAMQKAHQIHTHKEIGAEYIDPDGYIYIKIAEPNKWKLKHHWEWEKFNPPIEKDETLFFLDRNRQNCDINNLAKMKKKWIGAFNKLFSREEIFTPETFASACFVCEYYITSKDIKRKQQKEAPKIPYERIEKIRQGLFRRWSNAKKKIV